MKKIKLLLAASVLNGFILIAIPQAWAGGKPVPPKPAPGPTAPGSPAPDGCPWPWPTPQTGSNSLR